MAFSFTYRGTRSEDLDIEVLDVRRSILPPSQIVTLEVPGRDGAFYLRSEYGIKTFQVDILIKKQTTLEALQEKSSLIAYYLDSSNGLGALIFDDEPNQSYEAIISGDTDTSQIVRFRRGTITFIAPLPFSKSLVDKEFTISSFQATFTRATGAYNLNGEYINTNTVRYEAGAWGDGAIIEEGTTNLMSANQSSYETDTASSTGLNAGIIRDIKHTFNGNFSLKIGTSGLAADEGVETDFISVSPSVGITGSVYVIANKAINLKLVIREYTAGDVFIKETVSTPFFINDETGELVRLYVTTTTDGTAAKVKLRVLTTQANYVSFWIDGLQVEQKNYISSWQIGGSTRNKETLTIPILGYMVNNTTIKEGTIEMKMSRINPSSAADGGIFDWGAFSVGNTLDRLVIFHGTGFTNGLRRFTFKIVNGTDTTTDSVFIDLPENTRQGDFYYIAVRWQLPGYMKIDIYDIENKTMYSASKVVTINAPTMVGYSTAQIGSVGLTHYVNAIYDSFRAIKRMRTDEEIQLAAEMYRPLPLDAESVVKIPFGEDYNLYNTVISNIGTTQADPIIIVIVFIGATSIKVEHITTGKYLWIQGTFLAGDIIKFDGPEKIVYQNNIIDMSLLTLGSEFFRLAKDDNSLKITTDGVVLGKISYTPTWL